MKKKILLLLLTASLALSAACGADGKQSKDTIPETSVTTAQTQQTEDTTSAEPSETARIGDFDWDTALDNLYVYNLKIKAPFSMNSLGSVFYYMFEPFYNERGDYVRATIAAKDGAICDIYIYGIKLEEYTDDTMIDMFVPDLDGFEIQGISTGTSLEKVYEIWGKEDSLKHDGYFDILTYNGKDGAYLDVAIAKDSGKVYTVDIVYKK